MHPLSSHLASPLTPRALQVIAKLLEITMQVEPKVHVNYRL
jgi:hypothetical protein